VVRASCLSMAAITSSAVCPCATTARISATRSCALPSRPARENGRTRRSSGNRFEVPSDPRDDMRRFEVTGKSEHRRVRCVVFIVKFQKIVGRRSVDRRWREGASARGTLGSSRRLHSISGTK
jgi:hypothetical protein